MPSQRSTVERASARRPCVPPNRITSSASDVGELHPPAAGTAKRRRRAGARRRRVELAAIRARTEAARSGVVRPSRSSCERRGELGVDRGHARARPPRGDARGRGRGATSRSPGGMPSAAAVSASESSSRYRQPITRRSSSRSRDRASRSAARRSPARSAASGDGPVPEGRSSPRGAQRQEVAPAAVGAAPVAGLVGDDGEQPWAERLARPGSGCRARHALTKASCAASSASAASWVMSMAVRKAICWWDRTSSAYAWASPVLGEGDQLALGQRSSHRPLITPAAPPRGFRGP